MVSLYSIEGKVVGSVKLPDVFTSTDYRPDLIQRAVVSLQSQRRQRHGTNKNAGMNTTASYFGRRRGAYRMTINRGMSRLPREKTGGGGLGKVRRIPQSVGGRAAHPPKSERIYAKKMNKREYALALESSLAALTNRELVEKRGHKVGGNVKEFPIVVEDKFENLSKTKDVRNVLASLGFAEDLDRGKEKSVRAGKGKTRGRKYRKKKSLLIVINDSKSAVLKGGRNIPGVDVSSLRDLDVEILAPGTHAGRLSMWTKSALENVNELFVKKKKEGKKKDGTA